MRAGSCARWIVLSWVLAGCSLGNPALVVAPDGGAVGELDTGSEDSGVEDVGGSDVGRDVPARDVLGDVVVRDAADVGEAADAGEDAGVPEDLGSPDVAVLDSGPADAGPRDTGPVDTGPRDVGTMDLGAPDSGPRDSGPVDTGPVDTGPRDAGFPDVGFPDVGFPDVGFPDAGPTVVGAPAESCTVTGTPAINGFGRYLMTGSTASRRNDHRSSCGDDGEGSSDDDVGYLVTLSAQSRLTWTSRPTGTGDTFVPVVYITPNCTDQGSGDRRFRDEVACIDNGGASGNSSGGTVDLPAGNYFLVVDGYQSGGSGPSSGAYEVMLDVTSAETSPAYSQEALSAASCSAIPSGARNIADGDDNVSGIEALGFSFSYFGRSFDRLAYSTNGYLTFIVAETSVFNSSTWRNHAIPFSGQPRGVVAPFWDDLYVESSSGSDVYFWVDGSAPNRVAHVAWRGVTFYRSRSSSVSFEVRLLQTSNVIEFVYCSESTNNNFTRGGEATVGLEAYDGVAGRQISLNRTGAIAPNTGYRFTPR